MFDLAAQSRMDVVIGAAVAEEERVVAVGKGLRKIGRGRIVFILSTVPSRDLDVSRRIGVSVGLGRRDRIMGFSFGSFVLFLRIRLFVRRRFGRFRRKIFFLERIIVHPTHHFGMIRAQFGENRRKFLFGGLSFWILLVLVDARKRRGSVVARFLCFSLSKFHIWIGFGGNIFVENLFFDCFVLYDVASGR